MTLKCDICATVILPPVPPGVHQLRCPFDDFEFTFDNDAKQPIEKLYYIFMDSKELCLEVDLLNCKSVLRVTLDKTDPNNYDMVLSETDWPAERLVTYEAAKQLYLAAKDSLPMNQLVKLLKSIKESK